MSKHARLGPSAASRWIACPASVGLIEAHTSPDAERKSNAAADEGTLAHEYVEGMLRSWLEGGVSEQGAGVDAEMAQAVMVAYSYVTELVERLNRDGLDPVVYLEERVDTHYYTGRNDLYGTADIIVEAAGQLHVIDYKHGSGVFVAAEDNPQLKIYALGAMAPTAEEKRGDHGFDSITCTIIQPRCTGPKDQAVRSVTYKPDDLQAWSGSVLIPAANLTDKSGGIPVAGESQCRWCEAKPVCPAAAAKVTALCSVFEPVQNVEELSVLANASPDVLDVEQLVSIVENAPFITGWLKAVNDRVRRMLENHEPVPGLKLVRGRRMNKWNLDETELIRFLCKQGGKGKILQAELVEHKPISAARALKLKNFNPQQKKRLQECISKTEGTLSIAPESDERPNAIAPMVFEDKTEKEYSFL